MTIRQSDEKSAEIQREIVSVLSGNCPGGAAMPHSFLEEGAFGPEATAAMGEAFESACKEVLVTDQSNVLRELIATLIIRAARHGELDPVRLRTAAVAGFALAKSHHRELHAPNIKAVS